MNRHVVNRPRLLMLAWLISACAVTAIHAQGTSRHFGRRFLVTFPDTVRAYIGPYTNPLREDAAFFLFSDDSTTVTITAPGYKQEVTVMPNAARTVWLSDVWSPVLRPFIDSINRPQNNVFTITSQKPVGLTCYFVTHNGSEAFTPLPVEHWGTRYNAMAYRAEYVMDLARDTAHEEQTFPLRTPGEVIVIASEDGTDVTINGTTDLHVTYVESVRDTTFRLNAGQAVMVQTHSPGGSDRVMREIAGTRITANKPIGVISGNTRTQGGSGSNLVQTATGNSNSNSAVEWLDPMEAHGTTFVVRPFAVVGADKTEELIRVYGTSPGTTTVTLSNGYPPARVSEGSYVDYSYSLDPIAPGTFSDPFAIRTDKPAEAMMITGSFVRPVTPQASGELTVVTWSPAMTILPPRESWYNLARFHVPDFPVYLTHYAVITADSGASLWVDGTATPFDPAHIIGAPFSHVRIEVAPGDHTIRCTNGRCCAIAYGEGEGMESFGPLGTRRKDRDRTLQMPHPTSYKEDISIAYAYPVAGVLQESTPPDSIALERIEKCDSAVVTVTRFGLAWTFVPYVITLDPASVNVDAQVVQLWNGSTAGYRIRFKPADPTLDADGKLTLTASDGTHWDIPYTYHVRTLAVTPDPLALLDVKINIEATLTATLTNQRPFNATPISIRLRGGANGFSLRDLGGVGIFLHPGEATTITIAFTGSARNTDYYDTLEIMTECGTYLVPIRARTGPYPVPVITGKDWGERYVGTTNDTLSFVTNSGSLPYTIETIIIRGDTGSAFGLVAPAWSSIAPVAPLVRDSLGITFHPPGIGPFAASIELVTTDGDTARNVLRGIGIMPLVAAPDLNIGTRCLQTPLDTVLHVTNAGNAPLRIRGLTATTAPTALVLIDSVGGSNPTPFLPRLLAPNGVLDVPVRIVPQAAGALAASITVTSDATAGDSIIAISGTIAPCIRPTLVVDDHDFDSVFITLTKGGDVVIRNLGGGDALVTAMTLAGDTANAFKVLWPAPPFTVKDHDTVHVACSFTPARIGLKTAHIDIATDAGPLVAGLRGVGKKLYVPALIRRDYHARPGEERTVLLELQGRLDTLPVSTLDVAIGYRAELLSFLAAIPDSAAHKGWDWTLTHADTTLTFSFGFHGAPPAIGTLLSMRFLTRFDLLDHSELPFTASVDLPYVEIVPQPGLFTRDPICNLVQRLFVLSSNKFRLEQNVPNPLSGAGSIEFEIPFENPTRLIVYDALGQEALRLMSETLKAGVYVAQIPAGTLPSGLYYYTLTSGEFRATMKMVVQ